MERTISSELFSESTVSNQSSLPLRAAMPDSVVATTAVARPADHDFMRTC